MSLSLAELRRDYTLAGLRRSELLADPIQQIEKWLGEAIRAQVVEPNAMTLATADKNGQPSARTVLLKGVDQRGLVFFTNYESRKGRELADNPRAALLLLWRELERQISVCGTATKVSERESREYFAMRPIGSRLAAWVSRQSEVIPDRQYLEEGLSEVARRYTGEAVPAPPYWGGYVVRPETVEFWQGRPDRLHDRFVYTRLETGAWKLDRLSP